MTRCSTGRATQKYRGNGTDLSDILETPGDIIYADAAVSAENLVISGTTGDVLKVSASGIPEWGTSTSQWITSGDDISYSLGHVGIGTTSPDANLHVTGNTFVSTDLGLGGTLTMGNVLVEALHELSAITATGNVTPHVIEFTNPTTGLVTTGNVGIKTSTPLQTLEVNGSVGINHNGVGGYTFHTSTGALRAGIHSTGGNHLLFKAGSDNERMRLLSGGQLGIGTSTPSKPLTVDGNVHIPSGSDANSGSFPQNSVTRSIYFGGISQSGSMYQSKTAIVSAPWTQYGGTQSWGRHGLHFCVDSVADNGNVELGQTKMCINYLGNVGIGSWSTPNPLPQTMASVHGGRVLEGRDASGFEFIAASSDTTNQSGQFNGAFLIKNMDANGSEPHYSGMAAREGATTTAGQMDLLFYSGRDNYENNTPQMVIDPNGDVGIGTSTPGYTLDVAGDINFTGALTQNGSAYGGGGSGSSPWVTSGNDISYTTGRVGIGTNSPQGPLHVSSGTAGDCRLILQADTDNNDEGDNPRIEFWQDGAIQESAIGMTSNRLNLWNSVSSGGGIAFHTNTVDGWTNAIERMTITSLGNVGINQTSPNYTLDVAGDINFTGALTQNGSAYGGGGSGSSPWVTSGNDISYTTGRVGVGTSSPDANLHVEGNVYVSSNLIVGPTVLATPIVYQQQQKIQASDAQASDNFSYRSVSLSSDGNTALVGAYLEDAGGSGAGAAYVFTRSNGTWTQQQKIQASDAQASDNFGFSVSLSSDGNTALVGAYGEDAGGTNAGAAYVFTRSNGTWTQQQKIQASDPQASDYFGYSVSLSGDGNTALVGAYGEDAGGTDAGAAYIFTRSGGTWTQQQKIQASDAQAADRFGFSVSLPSDGNTALVGAYLEDAGGTSAGAAYVFTRSGGTWTQQQKIQASDPQASDYFGYSVSLSGDGNAALVGAYLEDAGGTNAGAAYVFTRSNGTWTQQQKIQASNPQASGYFGYSVSLSGDGNTALVGAHPEDTGFGAAYIFTRSNGTWSQNQKIQASDAETYDYFGNSVSLSGDGNTALVGAHLEDTGGSSAGAAYIFFTTSLTSGPRLFVDGSGGNVGIGTATPNYTLDVAGDLTCSGTMRHRAFAFYARASGGQIVAGNGILSDSNSTITTEFDYTPAGTASSNGFRSSGGASNNQGTYFAPLDGIYHVSCKVRLNDSSTAQQEIQWYIKRTNGNEDQWESFEMWISPADGGGRRATMSSTIVKLAKDEGIFPRADNSTTSLSSATFGGHFLGTY